jgi:hypothetical protein
VGRHILVSRIWDSAVFGMGSFYFSTTKAGKAKCLNYRNSKRCGRVAKYDIMYCQHHLSVCGECLELLVQSVGEDAVKVRQHCKKGFTVRTNLFGPASRTYVGIE